MSQLRLALAIARKDLRAEFRSKEAINAAVSFALVILLILSFAFEPTGDEAREIAGGLLWIVFAFAGALIINRGFAREIPNDCLDSLIAAPVAGWALFLGKAAANFTLLIGVEIVCLPVFSIFYDVPLLPAIGPLVLILVLGTWAMTVVGTAFSALTVSIQLREVMLPLMLYPTLVPALIACMQISASLLNGGAIEGPNVAALRLLVAFDIIYTALAVGLIDIVLVG